MLIYAKPGRGGERLPYKKGQVCSSKILKRIPKTFQAKILKLSKILPYFDIETPKPLKLVNSSSQIKISFVFGRSRDFCILLDFFVHLLL